MKRLNLMCMVAVVGLLMVLAITIAQRDRLYTCPPDCPKAVIEGDDARHLRLCQTHKWTDPEWWEVNCRI